MVGARVKSDRGGWSLDESLAELRQLAATAGLDVVGENTQALDSINPATYVGKGKLEELRDLATEQPHELVLFDAELSPTQQRNLEEELSSRVVDRTALILDIFAAHARSREGALQIELAQYEYRLPRLTRQWTHLSRQGVGGVGLRGPGETQLESDRRDIRRRITHLRRQLEEVRSQRQRYRSRRQESAIPTVAIVGYTNAGKSTLLNVITGADVLTEDKLFATLDPTTRRIALPGGREVLFTDTVGFIQRLPTMLVAAFRATLEEIAQSDLIVHVVDLTSRNVLGQCWAVAETLKEIGADQLPIITALNKLDRLDVSSPDRVNELLTRFPSSVGVSALTGQGIGILLERIGQALKGQMIDVVVCVPFSAGDTVALLHRYGSVESEKSVPGGLEIRAQIPASLVGRVEPFLK